MEPIAVEYAKDENSAPIVRDPNSSASLSHYPDSLLPTGSVFQGHKSLPKSPFHKHRPNAKSRPQTEWTP
jgi:hypothetical protein